MPKVSVITPTYNRADVIYRTIDSVLDQTMEDFEYIVVDDGSTDETERVVDEYDDDRLTYVRLPENRGANAARNRGIEEASGEYISFLDSDDAYLPERLDATVSLLDGSPRSVVGVTHSFESEIGGEVVRRFEVDDDRITIDHLRDGNVVGGFSNVLFRATVFDEAGLLDEEMPSYQDYEFYLRALQEGDLRGVDEVLCRKRKESTENSDRRISNDVSRKIEGEFRLLEKHGEKLSEKVRASFYYTRGRLYMESGNVAKSRSAFKNALLTYPYRPLFYYNFAASLAGRRVFVNAQRLKRKAGVLLSNV